MAHGRLSGGRGASGGLGRRLLIGCSLLAAVAVGLAVFRTSSPRLTLELDRPGIGPATRVQLVAAASGRGLGDLRLLVQQGDEVVELARAAHTPRPFWAFFGPRTTSATLEAEVGHRLQKQLRTGEATLRGSARRAGSWLRRPAEVVIERTVPVRREPPRLEVLSSQVYLRQGGAAVVLYRTPGAAAVGREGVEVGDWFFPGYPLPGAAGGERFALVGAPHDQESGDAVRLVAEDQLGNRSVASFLTLYKPHPPRAATIELSDVFLERVVPAIVAQGGVEEKGSALDTYLEINRHLRQRNDQRLRELARKTRPEFLWRRPFMQQPNTQVMDAFAARREYRYRGQVVDHQTHLGYDLASRRRDAVVAANRGVVVLAEYLGIYGNAVVLDHGYGLMTLYAHLSSIEVALDQIVERGAVVGRSGETGLAGGDHLHFSVLLSGLPVDAVEWWDAKFLGDRVASHLGAAALPFSP